MQASQESQSPPDTHSFYHRPMDQNSPYSFSNLQILNNDSSDNTTQTSLQPQNELFFTLESTPALSVTSSQSPFSPQCSNSYHSSNNTYSSGSPENELMHTLWVIRNELEINDSGSFNGMTTQTHTSFPFTKYDKILEIAPQMDLKQLLVTCAEIVSEVDPTNFSDRTAALSAAKALMNILEKRVSISGEPLQRLGAYMLEGLRARLLSSGSIIYKKLKCKEPTGPELMSYMHVLYQICPYYKFAYTSANVLISEAMANEKKIHIIDFQIAQGSQWISFIEKISRRPGGPPSLRITGVDDFDSVKARGGGLQLVGQKLAKLAESCGVKFEFHCAATSGCVLNLENLEVREFESIAVNFPFILHHMPDESVTTANHRDRLIRLVKSLSPKIVTLIEQESNTNTSTFFQRFCETLDYYTAMFESIEAARAADEKRRIGAEEHCVAKDVVNILACEGIERVERHELFGKWRMRFEMAGFDQVRLGAGVHGAVREILKEFSTNYKLAEANGALYLGWKNRALATVSAWR